MTEPDRIALTEEAESLPIHVRMCALRHQQTNGAIDGVREDIKVLRALLTQLRAGVWGAAIALAGMAGSIYGTAMMVLHHLAGR